MQGPTARIGTLAAAIAITAVVEYFAWNAVAEQARLGARRGVGFMNETRREAIGRHRDHRHQDYRQRRHRRNRGGRDHHLTARRPLRWTPQSQA